MENTRNKLVRLNIDKIIVPEISIKDFDYSNFERLKKSISKNGQIKNIVICETELGFECIDGGKILQALKELGIKTVIAFNLGLLSEDEKKQVRLEIFRDYFQTNYVNIGLLIKEISKNLDLKQVCNYIPFDITQAEHLSKMSDFDWEEFSQQKVHGQVDMFAFIDESLEEQNEEVEEKEHEIKEEKPFVFDFKKIKEPEPQPQPEPQPEPQLAEEIKQEETKVNDEVNDETQELNIKDEKIIEQLPFKIGDAGWLKTSKGDIKIEITNVTDKWVIFKESIGGKRKDCTLPLFKERFTKLVVREVEKAPQGIVLNNEDFFFDEENKKLIIKKNLGENFDKVKRLCRYLAVNKYSFNEGIIRDEVYSYNTLEDKLEITKCKLVDRFDVPRFIPLAVIAENL
jgi:hypothetical protein